MGVWNQGKWWAEQTESLILPSPHKTGPPEQYPHRSTPFSKEGFSADAHLQPVWNTYVAAGFLKAVSWADEERR